MNGTVLKVARIGNSRGIRLPAALLRKSLIAEEKPDKIELRPLRPRHRKLSWEATAEAMAVAHEDWSEWETADADGLQSL
jgi:antitoxin component of MazEF toxin-antitoxin module